MPLIVYQQLSLLNVGGNGRLFAKCRCVDYSGFTVLLRHFEPVTRNALGKAPAGVRLEDRSGTTLLTGHNAVDPMRASTTICCLSEVYIRIAREVAVLHLFYREAVRGKCDGRFPCSRVFILFVVVV